MASPAPVTEHVSLTARKARVRRLSMKLDLPLTLGVNGTVQVRVEDLEALAERLGK